MSLCQPSAMIYAKGQRIDRHQHEDCFSSRGIIHTKQINQFCRRRNFFLSQYPSHRPIQASKRNSQSLGLAIFRHSIQFVHFGSGSKYSSWKLLLLLHPGVKLSCQKRDLSSFPKWQLVLKQFASETELRSDNISERLNDISNTQKKNRRKNTKKRETE